MKKVAILSVGILLAVTAGAFADPVDIQTLQKRVEVIIDQRNSFANEAAIETAQARLLSDQLATLQKALDTEKERTKELDATLATTKAALDKCVPAAPEKPVEKK